MDDFELELVRRNPNWAMILNVYHEHDAQRRDQVYESHGWVPRVAKIDEIPGTELSAIHGKLIAFGFLKFDLAGRDGGIRYQLTPLGKQAINAPSPADERLERTPSERGVLIP